MFNRCNCNIFVNTMMIFQQLFLIFWTTLCFQPLMENSFYWKTVLLLTSGFMILNNFFAFFELGLRFSSNFFVFNHWVFRFFSCKTFFLDAGLLITFFQQLFAFNRYVSDFSANYWVSDFSATFFVFNRWVAFNHWKTVFHEKRFLSTNGFNI